ncbi:MAG TPA: hypothetical protein VKP60_01935 [Magnetospirillaceae bacterium]|nr:hypothetical protein [Magnetospirillaceae bacterium]
MIDSATLLAFVAVVVGLFLIPRAGRAAGAGAWHLGRPSLIACAAGAVGRWQGKVIGAIHVGLGLKLAAQQR